MNLKSIFNSRNYKYLYYKIKPYPNYVKNKKCKDININSLNNLVDYFEVNNFKNIVVVASGPSSKNIILDKNSLYIATNDSLRIVENENHIYLVQDNFYLTKYLKSFKGKLNWRGTIFFLENIVENRKSIFNVIKYLEHKSRDKKEFLISDYKTDSFTNNLFLEINNYISKIVGLKYEAINSGFMCLQFAIVISYLTNKPLNIYGLDMGVGGDCYYNKKAFIGKSINGNLNREKISKFLEKSYKTKLKINNYSNFMRHEI